MKKKIEQMLENRSTKDVFLFQISCGICGASYSSRRSLFSKAGTAPKTPEKEVIYRTIYEQELQAASRNAAKGFLEHMNYCPICKRLVCDCCFLICDDLDMCTQCAFRLNEAGSPVAADDRETIVSYRTEKESNSNEACELLNNNNIRREKRDGII